MPGLFRAVVTQAKQENEGTRVCRIMLKKSIMLSSVTRDAYNYARLEVLLLTQFVAWKNGTF